jgi:peroxiredoxin
MRILFLAIFLSAFQSATGQVQSDLFTIPVTNLSRSMIYCGGPHSTDSVAPGKTKLVRDNIATGDIPFLFFIFLKDSTKPGGFRSREIQILYRNVKERKITVTRAGLVNFRSEKSETAFDNYKLQVKTANLWPLTRQVIEANKNNIVSAQIINSGFCRSDYPTDSILMLFNLLSDEIKNSPIAHKTAKYIAARNQFKTGTLVRNFTLPDSSNTKINLDSIKSEYILLDFWFSTCKPCIESFPELISFYGKYSRDKIEIIGLSVDNRMMVANWRKAIKKYQLPWINLSDPEYSIAYYTFSIETYPTKILLDKQRRIVLINPELSEVEELMKR